MPYGTQDIYGNELAGNVLSGTIGAGIGLGAAARAFGKGEPTTFIAKGSRIKSDGAAAYYKRQAFIDSPF